MASLFKVCLTAAGKPRHIVEIEPDESIEALYELAGTTFGGDCVDLKSGFPPKSLDKSVPVRSVLLMNDRVTAVLAETKSKPVVTKNKSKPPCQELVQSSEITGRKSQRAAAKLATESFKDVIQAQDKLLREQKNSSKRKRTAATATTSPPPAVIIIVGFQEASKVARSTSGRRGRR
jgi:microcystin-dependent protein